MGKEAAANGGEFAGAPDDKSGLMGGEHAHRDLPRRFEPQLRLTMSSDPPMDRSLVQ